MSGLTVQEINKAIELCDRPLPNLPQGYFTVISRTDDCQVACVWACSASTPLGMEKWWWVNPHCQ